LAPVGKVPLSDLPFIVLGTQISGTGPMGEPVIDEARDLVGRGHNG
jgi:hypothetical protein